MTLNNIRKWLLILRTKKHCHATLRPLATIKNQRDHGKREKEQNGCHRGSRISGLLTGVLMAYAAYTLYDHKRYAFSIFPKTLPHNFIADVVDVCAPAVVYLEVKDELNSRLSYIISTGSGFIVKSDGLILTNAHVEMDEPHTLVLVHLSDGRTFPAEVQEIDADTGLATVRINCTNLPVIKLGHSATLRSGEWVVALGSPLDLSNSATAGVISSSQRTGEELGLRKHDINYIQTDADITHGYAGGPLVNLEGEAIGVNLIHVRAGISYAIPMDYVMSFLERAEERRRKKACTERRCMGVTMLTLTPDILFVLRRHSYGMPEHLTYGVLVWKVMRYSPADRGGLCAGDIITHINEKEIKHSTDVYEALAGDSKTLNLTIYRGLKKLTLTITPQEP